MPVGLITKGIDGFYYVKVDDRTYECKARGIFRKNEITPLPGDRVSIDVVDEDRLSGNIVEIMDRSSCLMRPSIANVDHAAIVIAARSPAPDFLLLDKLVIMSELSGIKPFICVNKIDMDTEDKYEEILSEYGGAGYPVFSLCAKSGTGVLNVGEFLKCKITVLAGQSGVGKSTILNCLLNKEVMETGEISRKVERGRHTTRHAELLELEGGGYIADTPGFSSLELTGIKSSELELYYPEFLNLPGKCRFTGCSHITEPDCKVREALQSGLIGKGRYERYVKFYDILKQQKSYESKKGSKSKN